MRGQGTYLSRNGLTRFVDYCYLTEKFRDRNINSSQLKSWFYIDETLGMIWEINFRQNLIAEMHLLICVKFLNTVKAFTIFLNIYEFLEKFSKLIFGDIVRKQALSP